MCLIKVADDGPTHTKHRNPNPVFGGVNGTEYSINTARTRRSLRPYLSTSMLLKRNLYPRIYGATIVSKQSDQGISRSPRQR